MQSGENISCLVLDEDWKLTPQKFTYKLGGRQTSVDAQQVQSVSIEDHTLYENHTVSIDRVADDVSTPNTKRSPAKIEKRLLLKVLLEGEVDLLKYSSPEQSRYFVRSGQACELLEYNLYRSGTAMGTNARYRQQLTNISTCDNKASYTSLKYKEKSLVKTIVAINDCLGTTSKIYGDRDKRKPGKLHVEVGAIYQSTAVSVQQSSRKSNTFNNGIGYYAGLGYEHYLPYDNNSMSVTAGAAYGVLTNKGSLDDNEATYDYSGVLLSLGLRRHFAVTTAQLVIGAEAVVENVLDSEIVYEGLNDIELLSGAYPRLLAGVVLKDRYALLVRYDFKNPTRDYLAITSDNTSLQIGLAVSIF